MEYPPIRILKIWSILPMALVLCLIFSTVANARATSDSTPFSQCELVDDKTAEQWLKDKRKIVFFGSWCHACKPHLEEAAHDPNSGLVLVFDTPRNGRAVLNKLNISRSCVMSSMLERRYDVTSLPRSVNVDN